MEAHLLGPTLVIVTTIMLIISRHGTKYAGPRLLLFLKLTCESQEQQQKEQVRTHRWAGRCSSGARLALTQHSPGGRKHLPHTVTWALSDRAVGGRCWWGPPWVGQGVLPNTGWLIAQKLTLRAGNRKAGLGLSEGIRWEDQGNRRVLEKEER